MRYFILSGEASGDLHGSNLVKELKRLDTSAIVKGWGGNKMQDQGVEILKHYKELAFMGFAEVLLNIRKIANNFKLCKSQVLEFKPDVLILIDYPGFNLRMAKWAKENKIKVFYYISPSVWAWKESRVEIVRKYVDKMFVILPFEKPFYAKHGIDVVFEGNPLWDAIESEKEKQVNRDDFSRKHGLSNKPLIAVLPGSRKQEISGMLPLMSKIQKKFPNYEFVIAGTSIFPLAYYQQYLQSDEIKVIFDDTHALMRQAHSGIIKSGTSTLESAIYNLPQLVCYKGSAISIWIASKVAKVKFISLPNLILNEPVLTELIQNEFNEEKLIYYLELLVSDSDYRKKILSDYDRLRKLLGGPGASFRVAETMIKLLNSSGRE